MSRTIDERVVEMQFDNQNFEKNVRTSLSTLDKLKEALNFKGISNSFDEMEKASSKMDFSGMSSGLSKISDGFSALETIAVGALLKIGSAAVDTGAQLVKSLTIDQITAGWQKFSDKTTSVATLVSQGYALKDVNEQLSRLNWFTDETSYNFTDMVANIAKFTATGKGLEESVTAMEGIANWAALSGQNAGTASRAMYQLSQALGTGYMRLEDWKSIQNVSMDTDEFRQKVLDTAVALGTLQYNADNDTYQSMINRDADEFTKSQFAQSLTKGAWFTADVMMDVYGQYASVVDQIYEYAEEHGITASQAIAELGDEVDEFGLKAFRAAQEARTFSDVIDATKDAVSTGWMNTFELIFGSYDEAKTFWTDLANELWDVFAGPQEQLNILLDQWSKLGGRNDLFRHDGVEEFQGAFWNLYDALFKVDEEAEKAVGIFAIVKEAFREVFPQKTALELKHITEAIRDFTKQLIPTEERAEKLKNTFKGVFAVFDILKQVVSAVWRTISPMLGGLGELGDKLLNITSDTGEWLANLAKGLRENDTVFKVIQPLGQAIQKVWSEIIHGSGAAIDKLREWWTAARTYLSGLDWDKVKAGLVTFGESVRDRVGFAIDKLKEWGSAAKTHLSNIDWSSVKQSLKNFGSIIAENIGKAIEKLKEWWAALREKREDTGMSLFQRVLERIKELLPQLKEGFQSFAKDVGGAFEVIAKFIKENVLGENNEGLINIAKAFIGFKLGGILGKIKDVFGNLGEALDEFKNVLKDYKKNKYPEVILSIAVAVGIFALAAAKLAEIGDLGLIFGSGGVLTVFVGELIGAIALLNKNKMEFEKAVGIMVVMLGISIALKNVAMALKTIADMDTDHIIIGVAGLAGALVVMVGSLKSLMKAEGKADMITLAAGLWALGKAVTRVANAILLLSDLDWKQVATGAGGITVVLLALGTAIRIMSGGKNGVKGDDLKKLGVTFLEIGVALELLADVIKRIGGLEWIDLGKAGAAIGGFFTLVTIMVKLMPSGDDVKGFGRGMLELSIALEIVADVAKRFGSMEWDSLIKAGVAIAGFFTVITIAIKKMPSGEDVTGQGLGILAMAGALLVLVPVLKTLGSMNLTSIGVGLLAIVGVFAAMWVGVKMFEGLGLQLLVVAESMALVGASFALFGAGLLMVTEAIAVLVAACVTLGAAGELAAVAFAAGLKIIINAVGDIIPLIIAKIGDAIYAIIDVIVGSVDKIVDGCVQIVFSVLDGLKEVTKPIADTVAILLLDVLDSLIEYGPDIIAKLLDLFILLMNEINARLPEFVHVVVEFVTKLFASITQELSSMNPEFLLQALEGIAIVSALMVACAALKSIAVPAMIGLAEVAAFTIELGAVLAALGGLGQIPGFTWLVGEGGKVLEAIGDAIGRLIGGFVGGIAVGATDELPKVGENLSKFAENAAAFIEIAPQLSDALLAFATAELMDGIASFFGSKDILKDFGEQLSDLGPNLVAFSDSVAGKMDVEAVRTAMEALQIISDVASSLPNSGGWLGAIVGENDIDDFVISLTGIGDNLVQFSKDVRGTDLESVKIAMEALQIISDVASNLPNSGGWLGDIVGNNDIGPFIEQLKDMGPILKSFSYGVKGLDKDAVVVAMEALQIISEVASNLPNSGGLIDFYLGNNDIDKFITKLKDMGPILTSFSYSVKGLDKDAIVIAMEALKIISDVASKLPNSGGVWGWLAGDNDIGSFGDSLKKFGEGLVNFYDQIKDLVLGKITSAASSIAAFAEQIRTFSGETFSVDSFVSAMKALGEKAFIEGLSNFGEALSGFFISMDAVNVSQLDRRIKAAKDLVGVLNDIDFAPGTLDFSSFKDQLGLFTDAVLDYSLRVSLLDPSRITKSITPSKKIVELWDLLASDENIVMSVRLDNFAESLPMFGNALVEYSDIVKDGIDSGAIRASVNAAGYLVELSDSLPNLEDSFSWLTGKRKEDLESFGEKLKAFGSSLAMYGSEVDKITDNQSAAIDRSITAAQSLVQVASVIDDFRGDVDISTFSDHLGEFGTALKEFAQNVEGISDSEERIRLSANVISSFTDVFDALKGADPGAMLSFSSVSVSFESLGKGISSFYEQTKGVQFNSLLVISGKVKEIIEILQEFESEAGSLDQFVNALSKIGTAIIEATSAGIDDKKNDLYENFTAVIREMVSKGDEEKKAFQLLGQTLMDNVSTGVSGQDSKESVNRSVLEVITEANNSMRSKYSDFEDTGKHLITGLSDKIKSSTMKQQVKDACRDLADAAKTALDSYKNDFKTIGNNLAVGFANGMVGSNALNSVANAARQLANRAINTMKQTLDEHSPSKVTRQIGAYAGEGFVEGVLSYVSPTNEAAVQLADAINSIAETVDSDYQISPVITPVVDMRGVYSARNDIQGMMSDNFALRTISTIGNGINRDDVNQAVIQNQNAGVISELRNMRGDLGSLGNRLARLQVVMDSGALVGAISGPMDSALGVETLKHRRGI